MPKPLQDVFLRQWSRYIERHGDISERVTLRLPDSLPRVWALSNFVAESCIQSPDLLRDLIDNEEFLEKRRFGVIRNRVIKAVASAEDENQFMHQIRVCRRQEMVRIAWRDLAGFSELDETLADLSELADQLIESALSFSERILASRFGRPADGQRLIVLSLGKLGGQELNFSSDVDLIFAFEAPGQTDGRYPLDHQEYFTRLAQRLIRYLAEITADGQVWRVDMRLRPFGDDGPLVMHAAAMENYYAAHGREWERYAWIKARISAGDQMSGERLLATLRPFVYRRYLDYGVFESLREMKRTINHQAQTRGREINLKLSPGGIREIEFIGQAYQLIRAGREVELQHQGIRDVLTRLASRGLIPEWAKEELLVAYAYLRQAENHLQMQNDQQTHHLPTDSEAQLKLAWSMGCGEWTVFLAALTKQMQTVHEHFERIFASPQAETEAQSADDLFVQAWQEGNATALNEALEAYGYQEPEQAAQQLAVLSTGSPSRLLTATARKRLAQLMPLLVHAIAMQTDPTQTLLRTIGLIQAMAGRSVYLALLIESPLALSQLVRLCAASPWIAQQLTRMPILLDELLDPRTLYSPPDRMGLAAELDAMLEGVPENDVELYMDRLRQFKAVQVLKVAAADVTGALPLMRVSDQLTWIAEVILDNVLHAANAQLVDRYGKPWLVQEEREAGFGIIGYGKLGGIELGYGSDLDIIFLYETGAGGQYTQGDRCIDNAVYFSRLAQRIIHLLTTYTAAGTLYEIDMRLRPSGASGLLVSSLDAFSVYQRGQAWVWEHQALVRARFITGSTVVADRFDSIREEILCRARDHEPLRQAVLDMRKRMWKTLSSRDPQRFDLKRDPGGIADIEFLVQYNVLLKAHDHPCLVDHTDNIRLLQDLADVGAIIASDAALLADIYKTYRDRIHALTLQAQEAVAMRTEYDALRESVGRIWSIHFGDNNPVLGEAPN